MDTIDGLVTDGRETALIAFTLVAVVAAIFWMRGAMKADKSVWKGLAAGFVIYIFVAGIIGGTWMRLANNIGDDAVSAPAVAPETVTDTTLTA